MTNAKNLMGTKPILPLLVSMSVPSILSMLIQSLYNVVDSIFVAWLSNDALTAVSLAYPLQNLVLAVAVGFGVGINAYIARNLGEGNQHRVDQAASMGVIFTTIHAVIFILVGLFGSEPFLHMFTNDPEILQMSVNYTRIVICLSFGSLYHIFIEKLFQAVGNMVVPMILQGVGAIVNIILDPILIFGLGPVPAMGIAGAALATGIGQLLSLCVYLFVYLRTELPVRLSRSGLHPDVALDGKLYAIGVPAILNLALPSLLVTFLNSLLAGFSQSYVVILGIYYKLQTFLYLPANGIVQGMRPLIGYNYGAREHARVKKLYELTLFMSIAIMALGTVICLLASGQLIGLFTSNPDTIAAGAKALRIICIGFVVSAVSTTSSGALEGLGKGVPSLVISLCRYVVFIMPLAAVLCGRLGPDGVWHAFWITEVLTALVAYPVYHRAAARH